VGNRDHRGVVVDDGAGGGGGADRRRRLCAGAGRVGGRDGGGLVAVVDGVVDGVSRDGLGQLAGREGDGAAEQTAEVAGRGRAERDRVVDALVVLGSEGAGNRHYFPTRRSSDLVGNRDHRGVVVDDGAGGGGGADRRRRLCAGAG